MIFVTPFLDSLFESDDGGQTWTSNPPPPWFSRPSWVAASTPLAANANRFELFFGSPYQVVRQTCTNRAGQNAPGPWVNVDIADAHDPNGFSFNASGNAPAFLVTDAGVYRTADGGMSFTVTGGGRGGLNAL